MGTVLDGLPDLGDYRVLVLPDHPTPIKKMTHTGEAVPFILFDSRGAACSGGLSGAGYNEKAAAATGLVVEEGHELMNRLVTGGCK